MHNHRLNFAQKEHEGLQVFDRVAVARATARKHKQPSTHVECYPQPSFVLPLPPVLPFVPISLAADYLPTSGHCYCGMSIGKSA